MKHKVFPKTMDDAQTEEYGYEPTVRLFNKPRVVNEVDAYLDGPILQPSYYRDLLHYMRMMEEGDQLRIWINCEGGHVDSMLDIVDAMQNCEGDVKVIVTGRAYSAASVIALCAPQLIVGENANFMLHNASWGAGGKMGEIVSKVEFTKSQIEKIMRKAYKWFLTDEELELLLIGKDFWFDSDEVTRRLEIRSEKQKDSQQVSAQDNTED